jgi:hypothetical protein
LTSVGFDVPLAVEYLARRPVGLTDGTAAAPTEQLAYVVARRTHAPSKPASVSSVTGSRPAGGVA